MRPLPLGFRIPITNLREDEVVTVSREVEAISEILTDPTEAGDEAFSVVNSYNEWDPLEEVIVGVCTGAAVPPWHISLLATMPESKWDFFKANGGRLFPKERINAANADLDRLARLLEAEGVVVRRPDVVDHRKEFSSPEWTSSGLYSAMPRDLLLVIGNEIIETPGAWRCRYFELNSYRRLLKEYFRSGAKWTAAPRPQLSDELYDDTYVPPEDGEEMRYVLTEFEPVFDAADFIRCGRDIFVHRSNVTNASGIEWLRRHLSSEFTVHEIEVDDTQPMHIDSTFMPLAPGKLLANPDRVRKIPEIFKGWDVLYPPAPCIPHDHPLYMSSRWIVMNLFMLDEERVIVEENEEPLIQELKQWGLEPIPCAFRNFNCFGGSFHCATLDVRRRGTLQSYF